MVNLIVGGGFNITGNKWMDGDGWIRFWKRVFDFVFITSDAYGALKGRHPNFRFETKEK